MVSLQPAHGAALAGSARAGLNLRLGCHRDLTQRSEVQALFLFHRARLLNHHPIPLTAMRNSSMPQSAGARFVVPLTRDTTMVSSQAPATSHVRAARDEPRIHLGLAAMGARCGSYRHVRMRSARHLVAMVPLASSPARRRRGAKGFAGPGCRLPYDGASGSCRSRASPPLGREQGAIGARGGPALCWEREMIHTFPSIPRLPS